MNEMNLLGKILAGVVMTFIFMTSDSTVVRLVAQSNPVESETPVGAVRKNRPPAPTGKTAENHYPEDFLTLSSPTSSVVKDGKWLPKQDSIQEPFKKDNLIFLLGAAVAVGLFLVVAWTDHLYRVRIQSVVAQNNRLLNGEDVEQFVDVPSVGIPLFLGTNQALAEDLAPALSDCLSEPLTEEISQLRK